MSTQVRIQSKAIDKSSSLTANPGAKGHFSGQRGFSAETRRAQIQTKLRIGQPGDKYEQEADRVADELMRMPDPAVQLKPG